MMHGNWRGKRLGAAITAWKYSEELVAGEISMDDWYEIEDGYACSPARATSWERIDYDSDR